MPAFIYAQEKFETFSDEKHNFSISYPSSWQIIHVHSYVWSARSELTNAKDKFEDLVQIASHSIHHTEYTMKEFDVANQYARKKLSAIEKISGSKTIAIEKAVFKDIPAVRIVYVTKSKAGHDIKCAELYVVQNKKIWTFSYTALQEDYDHWMPYVNKIWDSFKFSTTKK
jgi:hypothetical protein